MSKFIRLFLAALTVSAIILSPMTVSAQSVTAGQVPALTAQIEPRADVIEWRYKIENGRLYRRQYNATRQQWIGSWELAAQ